MSSEVRCQRPGCSGTMIDGVCDDCGRPAAGQSLLKDASGTVGTLGTAGTAAGTRGTGGTRRGTRASRGTLSTRSRLGGGLISLPPVPSMDPLKLVLDKPEVPAAKRICPHCEKHVNRDEGFCPSCGKPYSFKASLQPGDVVASQYEVKGPIGYGGERAWRRRR